MGANYILWTNFWGSWPLCTLYLYTQDDSKDMAGEVANDGPKDARMTRVLLWEQFWTWRRTYFWAQDSIGICIPGFYCHYYDKNFGPQKIEYTNDEMALRFLEEHLVMRPMDPRKTGCSVVEGKDITPDKVKALAKAASDCWDTISLMILISSQHLIWLVSMHR